MCCCFFSYYVYALYFLLLVDVSLTELTFLLLQNVRTRQFYRKVHLVLTVISELQPTKPVRRADFQMLRAVSLALFYRGEIKLSISSILAKTTLTFYYLFLARKCHLHPFWLIATVLGKFHFLVLFLLVDNVMI